LVITRLEDVKNHGKEIHKLLKDTFEHIKPDKKSPTWISYVDYVNSLVIKGITDGICSSMKYLADQISIPYNKHHQLLPIFDIRVDLQDRDVIFDPPINYTTKGNGIRDIIQKIIDDFISLSIQMPRLDTNSGDYLPEIKDQFSIFGATNNVTKQFQEIIDATD
jgi:dynein heavy chain